MKLLRKFALLIFCQFVAVVEVVNPQDGEPIEIPQVPRPPNCGTSFPGTQQWNRCWENFRNDMAWFQHNMQEYGMRMSKLMEKATSKSKTDFPKFGGTSNVMPGGYTIHTERLSISTTTQDGKLQIKLGIPGVEEIKSKITGNELELRVGSNENGRWAIIRFPESVKYTELKIQRTDEGVLIIGPVKNLGNAIIQQSYNFMSPVAPQGYANYAISSGNMAGNRVGQAPQMWFF